MNRLASLVVAGMMAVLLTACGKPAPKKPEAPKPTTEQSQAVEGQQNAAPGAQVQE